MRGSRRGPPTMISKPGGTKGVGSRAKVAIAGCGEGANGGVGAAVDNGAARLGDGGKLVGDGVMGGGSAGNGGSDGVAGVMGLDKVPTWLAAWETEASGEKISADRSGEVGLTRGTHL